MAESMDFESFLAEHEELTSQVDKHNAIALERRGRDDPFYVAQLLQIDLDKDPRYMDMVAEYAIETVSKLVTPSIVENRLAISTLRLCALDDQTRQSLSMSGEMLVSGVYQKFVFDTYDGDPSIALQMTDPYFIKPEMSMTPGTLLQINSLAIPISSIEQWRLLPRIDKN